MLGILIVKAKERTRKAKKMGEFALRLAEKLGTKCSRTKIRENVVFTEALSEKNLVVNPLRSI